MKRRSFLAASLALPFALRSLAEGQRPHWIFLGTDLGPGVYRALWNPETGEVGPLQVAATTAHPTYLALHPRGNTLYAANETEHGSVSAFRLHPETGGLEELGAPVSSHGNSPCSLAIDPSGAFAFAANYGDGTLCALPLGADGGVKEASETFVAGTFPGRPPHGPVQDRQEGPHLHSTMIADGHLFSCDLGDDGIFAFSLSPRLAQPLGKPMVTNVCRHGTGPRHVVMHPNQRWVYGINEMGCTVVRYTWSDGVLTPVCGVEVFTLRDWPAQPSTVVSTASEIAIEGDFLYAGTRGANILTVFRIDPASGDLIHVQTLACGGQIPRHFAVAPDGRFLLCANQGTHVAGSGNLTVFRRDRANGRLELLKTYAADTPMFVQFV